MHYYYNLAWPTPGRKTLLQAPKALLCCAVLVEGGGTQCYTPFIPVVDIVYHENLVYGAVLLLGLL